MQHKDAQGFTDEFLRAISSGGLRRLAKILSGYVALWFFENDVTTELEDDVYYKTWLEHFDCPINGPVAMVICVDAFSVFEDLELHRGIDWFKFLESMGLTYELMSEQTILLYPLGEDLGQAIQCEFSFDWASRLVAPDFSQIYKMAFGYFAKNEKDLHRLHWREFEELLASIFLENGYRTILGPGRADWGVDLRLTENDVYGQQVTIVQAKRYRKPITLEQVAALSGVVVDQNADAGMFVTTSRFLPSAQKFAQRQTRKITLATGKDVSIWCDAISAKVSSADWAGQVLRRFNPAKSAIVYANDGVTMIFHKFAYVVARTTSAALLLVVPSARVPSTGRSEYSTGYEVPDLTKKISTNPQLITARVTSDHLWGDDARLYTEWDGRPLWFDLND